MMLWKKEEILFEWMCPKEASIAGAKVFLRRWYKVFIPRVLFVTAIIWTGLYFAFDYVLPHDSGIHLEKLFIFGFATVAVFLAPACLMDILMHRFSQIKYRITSNRVILTGNGTNIIRWNEIVAYRILQCEEFGGLTGVQFLDRRGRFRRSICLPQDEHAADITKYIAQRVPLLETLPPGLEIIKLTVRQRVCLYISTVAYSMGIAWYIVFWEAHWLAKFTLAISILGPGTICLPIMFGKRFLKNHRLIEYAMMCNIIAWLLTMLLGIFLYMYRLKQEMPGW